MGAQDLTTQAQVMTAKANRCVVDHVNSATSRVMAFYRMNFLEFYASKVKEDPQRCIQQVYKVLDIMGVSSVEKAELSAYQLKDVAQLWHDIRKRERPIRAVPVEYETFKYVFLDRFFP